MTVTDNSQTLVNALAEIKRLEGEIQRQRERHRATWTQLEQVKGLLREIIGALRSDRDLGLWQCRMNEADRWEREAAALSQQAEPTDTFTAVDIATAAAQGFRDGQAAQVTYPDFRPQLSALVKACQRYIDSDGAECFPDDALIEATVALERDAHAASVRYAAPIAQTAPQPEQSEALEQILALYPFKMDKQAFVVNGGTPLKADGDDEFYSAQKVNEALVEIRRIAERALSPTPSPAMDAKEE